MIDPYDPVFPSNNTEYMRRGIDLRTYVAVEAMKGILAAMPGPPSEHSLDKVADRSFQMADKLIARGNYVEPIKDKVAPTDNAKSVGVGG